MSAGSNPTRSIKFITMYDLCSKNIVMVEEKLFPDLANTNFQQGIFEVKQFSTFARQEISVILMSLI